MWFRQMYCSLKLKSCYISWSHFFPIFSSTCIGTTDDVYKIGVWCVWLPVWLQQESSF